MESVLADIAQVRGEAVLDPAMAMPSDGPQLQVLVVDDSRVARQQIRSVLDQLGVGATLLSDGKQALDHLLQVHASGENPAERYAMVISDIEMPAMDGYTLTTEIRRHPGLAGLYVLLHLAVGRIQQRHGRARRRQRVRRQVLAARAGRFRAGPPAQVAMAA